MIHDIANALTVVFEVGQPIAEGIKHLRHAPTKIKLLGATSALGAVYFGYKTSRDMAAKSTGDASHTRPEKPRDMLTDLLGLIVSTSSFVGAARLSQLHGQQHRL